MGRKKQDAKKKGGNVFFLNLKVSFPSLNLVYNWVGGGRWVGDCLKKGVAVT